MATVTHDIVAKLWKLCDVLRDDGITYHQYVTELTYLLFLKMAEETGTEQRIAEPYQWRTLTARDGVDLLDHYREALVFLGSAKNTDALVRQVYQNAATSLRLPKNLRKLVEDIDKLDWYSAKEEGLGDLYEGLLEKNAGEKKSGAGQYFTPRPLIDSMVYLMQPQPGETIQDPAAGTAGFLIRAHQHIAAQTDDLFRLSEAEATFQKRRAYWAVELVPDTQRLALMNALLHDIEGTIEQGDALGEAGDRLPAADLILSNPPFGTKKGGGTPSRAFTHLTSNKQLNFLQHIYNGLTQPLGAAEDGGRAAVVLPDNVLFEDGVGRDVRRDLMDKCRLHTILRLPTGIFYAQGVKTNVLFFSRGATDQAQTDAVWVYDLRTNMPRFGKRTPLTRAHFAEFEAAYGDDPHGRSARTDTGEAGRFRQFTRAEIAERGDNLDLTWLRDEDAVHHDDLPEPEVLAAEILTLLRDAAADLEQLSDLLDADG
ncbi:MAG: N-6 DNA methylase [Bacteroidota bacterium]